MILNEMQDAVLLVHCKEQVLLEKGATARVLETLTEIDKRRLWVKEGYASLFDFCVRYLHPRKKNENRSIRAHAKGAKNYRARDDSKSGESV